MKNTQAPVIVSVMYPAPVQKVWEAITVKDQMVEWFFANIPTFEPVVGFKTSFEIKVENRVFLHVWQILEVEINSKITYDWQYEGYPGQMLVTFALNEKGEKTKLTLTSKAVKNFPDNVPEFSRRSCEQGWQYFIQKSLKEFLQYK